jgi:hypothetical protein
MMWFHGSWIDACTSESDNFNDVVNMDVTDHVHKIK